MGFSSFLGRVLFASVFILSAWQMFSEFGEDGGPAAKQWAPKLAAVKKFIDRNVVATNNMHIDPRTFVATLIFLKGVGGLLFVIGSDFGAHILMYYLAFTTPFLYDFFNYKIAGDKFFRLLQEFAQCVAFLGALLFYIGMKSSILSKQARKKTGPRAKTL